jgi:predicted unusual protein kinase regulating ubiquinone biosynthesis (AarF/ABC1/UbiB family)
MKAGQMLGYLDPTMPEELRGALSLLQTVAPTTPFETVRRSVNEAIQLDERPIAVASIGQVHRGRLPDGSEVAVKVRHPEIKKALAADFRTASVGKIVALIAGAGSVKGMIDEARTAFLEECDFSLEASRQERFRALFAGDEVIEIPEVCKDWCSDGVLVTRWLPGDPLDRFLLRASQAERDRAGEALFRFWLRTLYRDGLFHGDPHPGNFAFREGGTIALYDFGCVREFDALLRRGFARLASATRADDLPGIVDALRTLGARPPEDDAGREHIRTLLRGFFAPLLLPGRRRIAPDEGIGARDVMRDKRAILRMELPPRMLFLFRLRFGLYAVLARLGAECDWSALERTWAEP